MEQTKQQTNLEEASSKTNTKPRASWYQSVWRWHFYAGLIFAPFLIILALSGAVYLFHPQIESYLYHDLYYVQEEQTALSPTAQVEGVKEAYPDGTVTALTFYDDPSRTTEFSLMEKGQMSSIFVNPYDGKVAGTLNNEEKFSEIFKKVHSELFIGGTVANRIVELAACWAVILLITGLYIWWPRNKASLWGTVLPRIRSKGRTFWRDLHAVPAFWLSVFILILIVTGLPWSGVMGEEINRIATSTNTGYPPFAQAYGDKPESIVKTKDVAEDVPWATENVPVPASTSSGYEPLSLEDVSYIAQNEGIQKPYTISMPQGDKGVYTIATADTKPGDNATLHVDQYSGALLSDVRFEEYGIMAKAITLGIALHEGRLFGIANQIAGLMVCLGLITLIISSFIMWCKRKPRQMLGAPNQPKDKKVTKTVFIIMLGLGIIMPLVGVSIIIIYLMDRYVLRKVGFIKAWLY
ncbi:PepSY-associated TM helix domain-containing protein [Pseudalkalibacillus decolorationis]|uniref:PepSY-associated TM helix domain-containing protein n=1 Tax=Pseudalkalibacillus decolorationis TaxID=163879 RepID=UPI00214922EF|nr:PepSY domain-containing protein [Pseudalkalibacillus decolorationis]